MALLTNGYYPERYWAENYYADDYWPDGVSVTISSNLLTSGYWPSTYFPKGYWQDDFWQDYGKVPGRGGRSTVEIPLRKIVPVHHKYFSYVTFNLFVSAVSRLDRREIELLTSYRFIPAQLLRKIDDLLLIDEDLWLMEN